jgi:hypothetical protein
LIARQTFYCQSLLVISEIGSHFLPRLAWTVTPLLALPCIAGITAGTTTPSHWLRWGLVNFLPGLDSNCDPPNLGLQGARIVGLNHHTQLRFLKCTEGYCEDHLPLYTHLSVFLFCLLTHQVSGLFRYMLPS